MCHNLVQVTTTRMLKVRGQAYTRLKIKTYTVQCALLGSMIRSVREHYFLALARN